MDFMDWILGTGSEETRHLDTCSSARSEKVNMGCSVGESYF